MLTDKQCKNAFCPEGKARARATDSGGLYLEVAGAGSKRGFWKRWMGRIEKDIFPWRGKLPLSQIGGTILLQTLRRTEGQAHVAHLLDEAPVPLVVMAVEEAAANEGVAQDAVWRNVTKLARSLAVHRQGLWA